MTKDCQCKQDKNYKGECCLACKVTGSCLCNTPDIISIKSSNNMTKDIEKYVEELKRNMEGHKMTDIQMSAIEWVFRQALTLQREEMIKKIEVKLTHELHKINADEWTNDILQELKSEEV